MLYLLLLISINEVSREAAMGIGNMSNHKCNDNLKVQSKNLKDELSEWAVQNNIRLNALSRLLKIVEPHVSETLPLDARTLLKTPRQTLIREVLPGEYYHFGVYKGIMQFLKSHSKFASLKSDVEIMVNIDGLPISASSNSQLWPILCSVFQYNHVFMVGLYHGNDKKPKSSNDFLSDFINEIRDMTINGIFYDGKTYGFKIKGFSVDCPAKSYMLCVKGHGGYSSCTKCMTEGEYVEHRICFPDSNASLRTDEQFANQEDEEYHISETSLLQIPNLGLVTCVPFDYQHLICLGVTKKLLTLWLTGSLRVRLSFKKHEAISTDIKKYILPYVPLEFQRKPRSLNMFRQWKSTELRMLLLYYGAVVLKNHLKNDIFQNFLCLHIAIRFLCASKYCNISEYLEYCNSLLRHFVETFKNIYGIHHVSHNIHALVHLTKDIEKYSSLDNFSTFLFENYMQQIKKMIRKDDRPLQQIVRRVNEKNFCFVNMNCDCDLTIDYIYGRQHYEGPLLLSSKNPRYSSIKCKDFTLIRNDPKNYCCTLYNGDIIIINNIAHLKENNRSLNWKKIFKVKQYV